MIDRDNERMDLLERLAYEEEECPVCDGTGNWSTDEYLRLGGCKACGGTGVKLLEQEESLF